MRVVLAVLAGLAALASAKTYFKDSFDGECVRSLGCIEGTATWDPCHVISHASCRVPFSAHACTGSNSYSQLIGRTDGPSDRSGSPLQR